MESLKDFEWDTRYSSATHDLIDDFFVPALTRSKYYYRIAGFFSSTALAAALRGISSFIETGEKMYLIIGNILSEQDAEAINNGQFGIGEILEKKWEDCKNDFNQDIIKKRFELLSWLIANEKLEIKIGVNKDKSGKYLSSEKSLFHEKILIFEDYDGNMIQIDGSINETWKAWRENRESFCVHKSWIEGNQEFIVTAKDEFDKVWLNLDSSCEIMELPEAIKKKILTIKPKTCPTLEDERNIELELDKKFSKKDTRTLRKYQREAIDIFKEKDSRGILEMATGTGKTFTASSSMKELDTESKNLLIAVPQRELAKQWAEDCETVLWEIRKRIVLCYGDTDWKPHLSRELRQSAKEKTLCIIIVVLDTMRTENFMKHFDSDTLSRTHLIIDEVHEIGSSENRKILEKLKEIDVRMALSATPERVWDESGNQAIQDFFGGEPIFRWDLEKAINPPEGYEKCLSSYKYYVHNAVLNEQERDEYNVLSQQIRQMIAKLTKGGKVPIRQVMDDPKLSYLLRERAKIHKECTDKDRVIEEILDNHSDELKKCIIYCADKKHLNRITRLVLEKRMKCLQYFGDMKEAERERVFELFKEGEFQFLVAIKCLDQGIDLPFVDSAIILTSSRNPREYVQRRGRILRLHKEKEYASIHDIIVFPHKIKYLKEGREVLSAFEVTLIENQIERIKIFADNSLNKAQNLLNLLEYGEILANSRRTD